MQKEARLTRQADFSKVMSQGKNWADSLVAIRIVSNGLLISRFGFSVSKRVGNAIVRNKVKRRLREVVRSNTITTGWDVLIIARRNARYAEFNELGSSVKHLLHRSRILRPNNEHHYL